ncbi:hypothetical protein DRN44_00200 [Thermococci archaeon]|nr:MAG: hypothetical protein DRN44_00200 [Thermococci archaeon]
MEELCDIWKGIIDELRISEEEIRKELGISSEYSVCKVLEKMGEYWRIEERNNYGNEFNRKKWVRTATVKMILDSFGIDYDNEVLKLSIVLDAIVNSADDISDLKLDESSREEKIECLIRECLSWVLYSKLLIEFSSKYSDKTNKLLMKKYFIEISYIPLMERKYYEEIQNILDESEMINKACEAYLMRAVDIDIFSKLFLLTNNDLTDKKKRRIEEILRYVRALEILAKDRYDLYYDLNEQDVYTPLVALYNRFGLESIDKYVMKIYKGINERVEKRFFNDDNTLKIIKQYSSDLFNYFR